MVTNKMGTESPIVIWAVEMASVPTDAWKVVQNGPTDVVDTGTPRIEMRWSGCMDTPIMACDSAIMDR